jgi:hypothetical protein
MVEPHVSRSSLAWILLTILTIGGSQPLPSAADESGEAKARIDQVVKAAGGEDKLLKVFRFRERVIISDKAPPEVKPDEKGNRTSVVEIGGDWWIGAAKRDKEKVRILVSAWSLRLLLDPKSEVESLGDASVLGKEAFGLRVTGSVKEPVDLFFDRENGRLLCFDYTDTRHVVSEWKKTEEGHPYASRTIGYRFADRAKRTVSDKPWYQTDILELTVLKEVPAELKK